MGGFAAGVRRDRAAVDAALTLEWSQGQTEGKVNKVKDVSGEFIILVDTAEEMLQAGGV